MLQRELDEMTNWLRTAYTPQVIHPTPRDQREMDKWAKWCDSTPWGTHSPAPTPTPQSRHTDTRNRREHQLSQSASSSAQPSAPVRAPRRPQAVKREHTGSPTPTPTPTPTPGNRKGTQAHAPGVSTLSQSAPSLHSHAFSVRPVLPSRSPTNTSTSKMPPPQPPQPGWQDHRGTPGIPPEREHPPSSQPAFSSAQPNVSNPSPVTHDLSVRTGSMLPRPIETPTQPHESDSLLASLINALSAAAAATAAAATTTDKREVTNTAAVVAAIAGALSDYQATRPPPEIHRRGGRPPRKAPSRPRAHRQPRLSDAEAAPPGPLTESPHRRGVQRGGWRPPRRARGWTALQFEDGR
jgi:hypothetical protein